MMTQVETTVQYDNGYDVDEEHYMPQEDEWDRDLLLDPAWEKQQRKVSLENPVPAADKLKFIFCAQEFR